MSVAAQNRQQAQQFDLRRVEAQDGDVRLAGDGEGAEGFEIDVVTARSEFYRAPAALPEVQTSASVLPITTPS